MRYTATSRTYECPVCSKTNGNCRRTDNDLVLCMTGADGVMDGSCGYKYFKNARGGLWGIYGIPDENYSKDFNQEEYKRRQEGYFCPNPRKRGLRGMAECLFP